MAGDRKKLRDWSVKEFVSGYGDVIPDLNVDMSQAHAYRLVLEYEYLTRPMSNVNDDDDEAQLQYATSAQH